MFVTEITWGLLPLHLGIILHFLSIDLELGCLLLIVLIFLHMLWYLIGGQTYRSLVHMYLNEISSRVHKSVVSIITTTIIIMIRPQNRLAYTLTATIARLCFVFTLIINVRVLEVIINQSLRNKFKIFGVGWDTYGRSLMLTILVVDRYASGFFWTFPCPIFHTSMIMGFICSRVCKLMARTFNVYSNDRTLALTSVCSMQLLSYACIPILQLSPEIYENSSLLPSNASVLLPDTLCESIMENRLDNETFQAIVNIYTGWGLTAHAAKVFYTFLREASNWRLTKQCDLSEPFVWNVAHTLQQGWISLSRMRLPIMRDAGFFTYARSMKEVVTMLTAIVSGASGLAAILKGKAKPATQTDSKPTKDAVKLPEPKMKDDGKNAQRKGMRKR